MSQSTIHSEMNISEIHCCEFTYGQARCSGFLKNIRLLYTAVTSKQLAQVLWATLSMLKPSGKLWRHCGN